MTNNLSREDFIDVIAVKSAILVERLNEIFNKKHGAEDTAAEMLNLLDENKEVVAHDSALKESHRLLNIWSRTESDTSKYLAEVQSRLNLFEMKTYEVGFRVSGSVTVTAANETEAMELLKNSDHVSSYELFEGIANNISDAGNDAITIDDVWETTEVPTEEVKHAVVNYTIICGESHIPKKKLISFTGSDIDSAVHEHFKDYWGEDKTYCADTGYRYNRTDWQEAISVKNSNYVSSFEAEILRKFL